VEVVSLEVLFEELVAAAVAAVDVLPLKVRLDVSVGINVNTEVKIEVPLEERPEELKGSMAVVTDVARVVSQV